MSFVDNTLRDIRRTANLSQTELANAVGISRQAYAAIERGATTPSTGIALRLARVLGTTVEALFKLADHPPGVVEAEWVHTKRDFLVPCGPDLPRSKDNALPMGSVRPDSRSSSDTSFRGRTIESLDERNVIGRDRRTPVHGGPAISPGHETAARVDLHQVGGRWLARPLQESSSNVGITSLLPPAHGMAGPIQESGRTRVDIWGAMSPPKQTLVAAGCDPAAAVVAAHPRERGVELAWFEQDSRRALEQLAHGYAHVAGCHLLDGETGTYNRPWAQRLLPFPSTVVSFAVWHQGLVVAPGNPKQVRVVEDLARPGMTMINREPGSGSRALLDRILEQAGVPSRELAGYERQAPGHLMIAQVVAMGLADAGVSVKAAALAAGLEFIPLDQERYDLVIPDHFLDLEPVQELLSTLGRPELRRQVEALGGYDITNMGAPVAGA